MYVQNGIFLASSFEKIPKKRLPTPTPSHALRYTKWRSKLQENTPLKKKWFLDSPNAAYLEVHPRTCKWLVTPIYKPWKGHLERGTSLVRGLTITMVINHVSKFLGWSPSLQVAPGFPAELLLFLLWNRWLFWLSCEGFCATGIEGVDATEDHLGTQSGVANYPPYQLSHEKNPYYFPLYILLV